MNPTCPALTGGAFCFAAADLEDDEKDAIIITDSIGRPQRVTVVNEADPQAGPAAYPVCRYIPPSRKFGPLTETGNSDISLRRLLVRLPDADRRFTAIPIPALGHIQQRARGCECLQPRSRFPALDRTALVRA
jgi:hypothetical protein